MEISVIWVGECSAFFFCFNEIENVIQPYLEVPSSTLRFMSFSGALSRNNVAFETELLSPSVTVCEPGSNWEVFQLKETLVRQMTI